MKYLLLILLLAGAGCAKKSAKEGESELEQSGQPACTASFMTERDNYYGGYWFQFRAPGITCVGKHGDAFARCSMF